VLAPVYASRSTTVVPPLKEASKWRLTFAFRDTERPGICGAAEENRTLKPSMLCELMVMG